MTGTKTKPKTPNRGGRPSRQQAGQIEDKIFDAAAALFLGEGYGAVSIEQIARAAQISKRTFYARFEDKAALFRAVVHRIIHKLHPPAEAVDKLFEGPSVEAILRRIAPIILHASLTPDALALQRLVLAEAKRFPELALIMNEQSMRQQAIARIAGFLTHKTGKSGGPDPVFAAEHFMLMVTSAPQRRAMGLGAPMTKAELDGWSDATVDLFLRGWNAR